MSSPFSDGDNEVDIDAVWAQIVANWDEEAPPREPRTQLPEASEDDEDGRRPRHSAEVDLRTEQTVRREAAHRAPEPEPYDYERDQLPLGPDRGPRDVDPIGPSFLDGIGESDEESYEPPPPPPLPRPSLVTALAWAAAIGGPLFLVFCAMFWRGAPSLVVAGAVAAFAGGFVTLVLRMSDHDSDDGAVV